MHRVVLFGVLAGLCACTAPAAVPQASSDLQIPLPRLSDAARTPAFRPVAAAPAVAEPPSRSAVAGAKLNVWIACVQNTTEGLAASASGTADSVALAALQRCSGAADQYFQAMADSGLASPEFRAAMLKTHREQAAALAERLRLGPAQPPVAAVPVAPVGPRRFDT